MSFKDYFSKQSSLYALSRPGYPEELFSFLASVAPARDAAWDCATGNGQAAIPLAKYFRKVIATDASPEQIKNAVPHPKVHYLIAPAENSMLGNSSVDLVTVANGIHWFELQKFYREVNRVLRPGGIMAAWCYAGTKINGEIDPLIDRLAKEILENYWPEENQLVWTGYRELYFPFEIIETPEFICNVSWNMNQFVNYLNSWSASQRYILSNHESPVNRVIDALSLCWGNSAETKEVHWDFFLKAGRKK